MYLTLVISLTILGQSAIEKPTADAQLCQHVMIPAQNIGDVPRLRPWPDNAKYFAMSPDGLLAMDKATAWEVKCRLWAVDILPAYFADVMKANVDFATTAQKIEIGAQQITWWRVAEYTVGALVVGYLAGRLLP